MENNQCPMCGMERSAGDDEYECVRCGGVGCDCCVPGNHAICINCEDDDAREGRLDKDPRFH